MLPRWLSFAPRCIIRIRSLNSALFAIVLVLFLLLYVAMFFNGKINVAKTFKKESGGVNFRDMNKTSNTVRPSSNRECIAPKDHWFPLCRQKFKEFEQHWNEECHGKKFKVNTSDPCSVLVYLSEVEAWCPRLPWRPAIIKEPTNTAQAEIRTDIQGLFHLLKDDKYAWIRMRANSTWVEWVEAVERLGKKEHLQGRKGRRIVMYMGAFDFLPYLLTGAFSGGPLGELVQWTDLICTLYVLGYQLIISSDLRATIKNNILTSHQNGCSVQNISHVDYIFTDILGTQKLKKRLGATYSLYKCKLLLLDSFGTEAEFNHDHLGLSASWGNLNLQLKQFMTMFPHSPDNSFMGFAIPIRANAVDPKKRPKRKMQGLIYAKSHSYYKGKRKYLDILHKYLELHGTISGSKEDMKANVPDYVINHGIVKIDELVWILQESKVFIGLGFPFEGPAPLDAVANGCFYVNPKLIPPQNRENSEFFIGKPTHRKVTSQNPYAEDFIGSPYVYTIDMNNDTVVENTIKEILASKEIPHLPYEFTHQGMLHRVKTLVENLDFCTSGHQWPPTAEMKVLFGHKGESCKEVCFYKGFLCEPAFFRQLNNMRELKRAGFDCKTYREEESIYAPSLNSTDGSCLLQDLSLLYSCVASHPHITRICPCRTYQKEQVALYQT